jgi:hypothetical protein
VEGYPIKLIVEKRMLSIEKTKELLNDKNISDEEAEKIRDDMRTLAEIIFDKWLEERKSKRLYEKK